MTPRCSALYIKAARGCQAICWKYSFDFPSRVERGFPALVLWSHNGSTGLPSTANSATAIFSRLNQRLRLYAPAPIPAPDLSISQDGCPACFLCCLNLGQILGVLFGDQHDLDATALCSQQLLLQNRQSATPRHATNLTRHGNIARTGMPVNAETIAVHMRYPHWGHPWESHLRQVNMQIRLLIESSSIPNAWHATHHTQGCLNRLLHHLAQLACRRGLSLSRQNSGLDGQQLPPTSVQAKPVTWPT